MLKIGRKHWFVRFSFGAVVADGPLQKAMQVVGLTDAEQTSILRVLATILWLGNVTFREGDDGNAAVADTDVTDFVAYLMETRPDQVVKVLTTRIMETTRGGRRGELIPSG